MPKFCMRYLMKCQMCVRIQQETEITVRVMTGKGLTVNQAADLGAFDQLMSFSSVNETETWTSVGRFG